MKTTTLKNTIINGVNTHQLNQYVGQMGKNSPVGVSKTRLRHTWKNGFTVNGHVEKLEEAGEKFHRTHHTFTTDWPEPFSKDMGPTPGLELILACVGACAATSFVMKASLMGIKIDDLDVVTEGFVDLKGLFEADDDTPARLQDIIVSIQVRSDVDSDTIQKIAKNVQRTSPVIDSLVNPVSIDLTAEKSWKE